MINWPGGNLETCFVFFCARRSKLGTSSAACQPFASGSRDPVGFAHRTGASGCRPLWVLHRTQRLGSGVRKTHYAQGARSKPADGDYGHTNTRVVQVVAAPAAGSPWQRSFQPRPGGCITARRPPGGARLSSRRLYCSNLTRASLLSVASQKRWALTGLDVDC